MGGQHAGVGRRCCVTRLDAIGETPPGPAHSRRAWPNSPVAEPMFPNRAERRPGVILKLAWGVFFGTIPTSSRKRRRSPTRPTTTTSPACPTASISSSCCARPSARPPCANSSWPWCSSTWTASSSSTIPMTTPPATSCCCDVARRLRAARCGPATSWGGWGATSSWRRWAASPTSRIWTVSCGGCSRPLRSRSSTAALSFFTVTASFGVSVVPGRRPDGQRTAVARGHRHVPRERHGQERHRPLCVRSSAWNSPGATAWTRRSRRPSPGGNSGWCTSPSPTRAPCGCASGGRCCAGSATARWWPRPRSSSPWRKPPTPSARSPGWWWKWPAPSTPRGGWRG